MKRILLTWLGLLVLSHPAQAQQFCSYASGAPVLDTDVFIGSKNCAGTRKFLAPEIADYVLAHDAQVADVAGLTATDNAVIIGNGTHFVIESGATLKTSLGLTIGTDVQAYNATLAAVAGGTYSGDDSITTLGTIGTGTWHGTAIGDSYISSASTWNAKQAAGNYITALTGELLASGPGSVAGTLNITGTTAETAPQGANDSLIFYDASAGANRSLIINNLYNAVGNLPTLTAPDETNDFFIIYDASAGTPGKKINGVNTLKIINGLTEDTTPDFAADFLPSYDVSATSPKKIKLATLMAGNAGTATALAANGSNCSAGNAPLGVDASGAVESCTDYEEDLSNSAGLAAAISDESGTGVVAFTTSPVFTTPNIGSATGSISGNAGTATALFANGSNCSAGQFPLGVDASGAVETCTALPTTISGTANEISASGSTGSVVLSLPSTLVFTSKTVRIPNSTSLPGTCTTGDFYMDTDATSGQRFYLCESSNTWVKQGDGTGGGGFDSTAVDATTWSDGANASNIWTFDVSGTDWTMTAGSALATFSQAVTVSGTLSTPTLSLTGTGTLNGLDAIDATGETTLEAALDIGGEVTSTGMGSTVVSCTDCLGTSEIDDLYLFNNGDVATGTYDFGGASFEIPNSTSLPGTCVVGQTYMDTDATSGQRFYLCESSNTWVKQGDGTGGGGGSPGGSNTQVQFNDSGSFGGTANLTYFTESAGAVSVLNLANASFAEFRQTVGTVDFRMGSSTSTSYIDTFSNHPMRFFTNNTDRGGFSAAGAVDLKDLAGSGTRLVTADSSGVLGTTTNAATATALATPRAIYGNNFDGSAALTQIIASTYGGTGNGFTKFSGPASTEKTFTLPNASDTLGALGTAGTWTGIQTFNSGKLILAGATSGTTTLNSGGTAGSSVLTLPVATDTLVGKATTDTLTNKDLSSGTNTFPTLNQNTTGSAAKWTTARTLAGNSVDGSTNVSFANKFIVQGTSDSGLSAAQFLGALGTGLLKNTTTTGVLSIGTAGTDYYAPSSTDVAVADGGTGASSKATAQDNLGVKQEYCVALSDQATDLTTGAGKATLYFPAAATVDAVRAYTNTAPTGSTIIVDINEAGSTLMSSTKLSIDASEKTSGTAASAAALTDTSIAANAEITFDIDQVGSSTKGKGLVACVEVTF